MRTSHTRVRNRVLGPSALAVISCALALLAAQPVMASTEGGRNTIVAVRVAGVEASVLKAGPSARCEPATQVPSSAQPTFLSSARRLHVLATVEILHRLLAFELRSSERPFLLGTLPCTIGVFCAFETPIAPPYRIMDVAHPPVPAEHDFVMARCLLAPPLV